jgi:hypothetical protein
MSLQDTPKASSWQEDQPNQAIKENPQLDTFLSIAHTQFQK